jgi:hypothetical protein
MFYVTTLLNHFCVKVAILLTPWKHYFRSIVSVRVGFVCITLVLPRHLLLL